MVAMKFSIEFLLILVFIMFFTFIILNPLISFAGK